MFFFQSAPAPAVCPLFISGEGSLPPRKREHFERAASARILFLVAMHVTRSCALVGSYRYLLGWTIFSRD